MFDAGAFVSAVGLLADPFTLMLLVLGIVLGLIIGILPGLGPPIAIIALLSSTGICDVTAREPLNGITFLGRRLFRKSCSGATIKSKEFSL